MIAMRYQNRRSLLLPVAICFFPLAVISQAPSVQTTTDKNEILIGEQVKLRLKALYDPSLFKVSGFLLPDSVPHFEVIEKKQSRHHHL
jgi:hypothetical protein